MKKYFDRLLDELHLGGRTMQVKLKEGNKKIPKFMQGKGENLKNYILIICAVIVPCGICVAQIIGNKINYKYLYLLVQGQETGSDTGKVYSSLIEADFINSGLAILAIAVSVWIGLNIYNNCKESYLERQLEELKDKHLKVEKEYQKQIFLNEIEQTEGMYELSHYFRKAFQNSEAIGKDDYEEFYEIEKIFGKCVKAYESQDYGISRVYAEELRNMVRKKMENNTGEKWSIGDMYLRLRLSDAMYYHADKDQEELLESVKIYEEAMKHIEKTDNEFVGYMENTIGYTYSKLYLNSHSEEEKEGYGKKAEKYLSHVYEKNHKGRYLQNLGAYYENLNTVDSYKEALNKYYEALEVTNVDKKIYNLLGAVMLKIVENKMGINDRFKNKILLFSFDRTDDQEIRNYILDAYSWLHLSVSATPKLINAHYNLAKAALYYAMFVADEDERKALLKEAELSIRTAENMDRNNKGMLFTKRNYYEATGNLSMAIAVNNRLKEKIQ